MTKWVHKLNFKDLWESERKGDITTQELSKKVAERIQNHSMYKEYTDDLEPIVDEFTSLSEDSDADVTYFDNILSDLYDWADQELDNKPETPFHMKRKMCWIETF